LGDRYAIGPLSCLSVLSGCDVGVLWLNGWIDQDEAWYGGRARPKPHCVRWGPRPQLPTERGMHTPLFGQGLLWSNGRASQQLL